MAAHLALNGINVTLWNRTSKNIQQVIDTEKYYAMALLMVLQKLVKLPQI